MRDGLKLPHWITILGAFLFTILAVNYRALGHGQFVAISYIPLMMWLALQWLIRDGGDTVGHFAGPALAVLSGLVAFSTFYLAWFAALFSTILALLAAGYSCVAIGPMRSIKMAAEWLVARRLELAATAICGATVWSLFLRLYLPRLKEHGGYSLAEIMERGQGVHDVVVAGPQNWLWGWPLNQDPQTWGFPPFFSVMTITGILFGVLAMRRRQAGEEERLRARYAILLGVAGILMWVSFLNFGGWTAYAWIYEFFPGGRAMRVPLRITLFLGAVFVPVAMIGLHELMRAIRTRRHLKAAFFSILALAFLLEQGTSATPAHLSRNADRRLLRVIPPPPTDCKAFYVECFMERRGTDPLIQYFYGPTTDAMLLAYRFRLPTLNGFLTVVPKDWNLMPPLGEDYVPKVQRWIQQHGLSKVCHLHLAQQTWSVPAE